MNYAEKLAATYLRLNGFLLLPQFTIFAEDHHNHVDLIGYRVANSKERAGAHPLPVDDSFFEFLTQKIGTNSKAEPLAIAVQVKTNEQYSTWDAEHKAYVSNFLGGADVLELEFRSSPGSIWEHKGRPVIGLEYATTWIRHRIKTMSKQDRALQKIGSWTWSEDFLAEFLVAQKYEDNLRALKAAARKAKKRR